MNFLQVTHAECGHKWSVYFPANGTRDTAIDDCPECAEEEEEREAERRESMRQDDLGKARYYHEKYGDEL